MTPTLTAPLTAEERGLIADSLRAYGALLKKLAACDLVPGPVLFDLRPMLDTGFERLAQRVEDHPHG